MPKSDSPVSWTFQQTLDHIRATAKSETEKGAMFAAVMREFFLRDPIYEDQFSEVQSYGQWASTHPDEAAYTEDLGIDLVATLSDGSGFVPIQCKCYSPGTRIAKKDIDSFVTASSQRAFQTETGRIFVDTGAEWNDNALKMIRGVVPRCQLLQSDYLAKAAVAWPNLARKQAASALKTLPGKKLRKYQKKAVRDVRDGFAASESGCGKLIMACGTGKTFTALRIAEDVAGAGGRVLYLVPSISLLQQTMREWAEQRSMPHRYLGICSDATAGRKGKGESEDVLLEELEIPVTTDPKRIAGRLKTNPGDDSLRVAFCTYHSLPLVIDAQKKGAPEFDLVIADEAHRTTGVERPPSGNSAASPFLLVHDKAKLRAARRLFMTATPRLYTESAKGKAKEANRGIYSMDGSDYGDEFFRMPFSEAVEDGWLSDYKVIVLTVEETASPESLKRYMDSDRKEVHVSERARILGCWHALRDPEGESRHGIAASKKALKKALVFTDMIRSSRRYAKFWAHVVEEAIAKFPDAGDGNGGGRFRCVLDHADGTQNATIRRRKLAWLGGESDWDGSGIREDEKDGPRVAPPPPGVDDGGNSCRVLSNARCLAEGIDVPALDAVIFLSPKRSQVDIVQAVGRVMRKAKGKKHGYIILPVAVPPGVKADRALDHNDRYQPVWNVLKALRSHDDRFDIEVNTARLKDRVIVWPPPSPSNGNGEGEHEEPEQPWLDFPPMELDPGAIYTKIVDNCGDRKYWVDWANDVGDIFQKLQERIAGLLEDGANETLRGKFKAFLASLKDSINDSITHSAAVDMMAQHIVTKPVFSALFENYDFNRRNPVARSLQQLTEDFSRAGLQDATADLRPFYESVQKRARALESAEERQKLLMELYGNFFAKALPKEAERLGIVYTPTEIVDFILRSADAVLRDEFGRGLTDRNVHVLDPFTGTGIFIVRLLDESLGLVRHADIDRKYRKELHANEIVLLAYYIASIHVEEAYHGRRGGDYAPFDGLVLTDTFNLYQKENTFEKAKEWLPDNSERAVNQLKQPIEVIVGNPPWSAWQESSADENPNVDYPHLEKRVAQTYAARSSATLKNSLYDTYKMAIRWASDRISEQGVVAFVTNGSWITGHADSGVRACLAEEFSSIYVLNLRGNQRTQGKVSDREGGKVFGSGSRAPVAITLLVKNPHSPSGTCLIRYHDIGDYLTRDHKLRLVREAKSIRGIQKWTSVRPDQHHDWLEQRDPSFESLYPMGTRSTRPRDRYGTIFGMYSNGYKTGRDAYLYNFSGDACAANARRMVGDYNAAMEEWRLADSSDSNVAAVTSRHSEGTKWDPDLRNKLRSGKDVQYSRARVRETIYRPFVKQYCYTDYMLAQRKGQMNRIFPTTDADNQVICVPGIGSKQPFSTLMVDAMPDLGVVAPAQCFPRYRYSGGGGKPDLQAWRTDNISNVALSAFRDHYRLSPVDRDAIFYYVYGLLHSPLYRRRFASNLTKGLPRIPFASDFLSFSQSGRALAELHLGYETCAEYPLAVIVSGGTVSRGHCRLFGKAMRLADDRSTLIVNESLKLTGIPPEAHRYQVDGRSPLGWFIYRYQVKTDKRSGIVNDPNGWFEDDPLELIAAIKRIVYMSVETTRIVASLPDPTDTRKQG